jgi:hypothetical protein
MELRLNVKYKELINVIKALPIRQIKRLKKDILRILSEKEEQKDVTSFQHLLLSGPVMDDEQYTHFKEIRKRFNIWRMN